MAIDRSVVADGRVHLYVSGLALAHPGPGGYAVMVLQPGQHGSFVTYPATMTYTTTRRCLLHGIIRGLEVLPKNTPAPVIHVDSTYVVERFTENRKPEKNMDLWAKLLPLVAEETTWMLTASDDENGAYVAEIADLYAAQAAQDVGMVQGVGDEDGGTNG